MTKIMLVEDDKSLREIYGVRLQAEGYEITSAGDGEEALAMAIKEKPDLIISDVMMPKISGFDMLDILRSTPETRDLKIIMMTALSSEDQRARGETLGANRYLVKSQVGIEDVVRTVHELLNDAPVSAAPAAPTTNGFSAPLPTAATDPEPSIQPKPLSTPTPEVTPPQPITMPQSTAAFSTPAPTSVTNIAVNTQDTPEIKPADTPPMATTTTPTTPTETVPAPSPEPEISPIPDTADVLNQQLNGDTTPPPSAPQF